MKKTNASNTFALISLVCNGGDKYRLYDICQLPQKCEKLNRKRARKEENKEVHKKKSNENQNL